MWWWRVFVPAVTVQAVCPKVGTGVIWVIFESVCGVIVSPNPHQQPSPRNKDIKACVCVCVCRRATDRIYSALTSVISRLIRHGPKVPGRFPWDEWCTKGKGGRALLSSCSPSLPLRLFSLISLWYFYLESPFPTSFKILLFTLWHVAHRVIKGLLLVVILIL